MTTSRPLISAMQLTLDGYSSPGDADWVDSWADGLDLLPPVDAFILGGGMFPDYEQFWATILDDPRVASEIRAPRRAHAASRGLEDAARVDLAVGAHRSRSQRHPYLQASTGQGRICRRRAHVAHKPDQRRPARRAPSDRPPGDRRTRSRILGRIGRTPNTGARLRRDQRIRPPSRHVPPRH
jgi:hypothetical protein